MNNPMHGCTTTPDTGQQLTVSCMIIAGTTLWRLAHLWALLGGAGQNKVRMGQRRNANVSNGDLCSLHPNKQ